MWPALTSERSRRWATPLGVACAVVVLMLRRTDQLTDPQVWVEEGTQIIPSFLEQGARAFLVPVNGYLITISKVVSYAALKLGGLDHYPLVSTSLGLVVTAAALAWLGSAPLLIRGGALLPIAVALVPSDVEVFVVPQYTFWFAGLALFTLVLWKLGDHSWTAGRIAVGVVGGLSNPIVILLAPIALVRAALIRTRDEQLVALSMLATAATQLWLVQTLPGTSAIPPLAHPVVVFCRFLAYPLVLGFKLLPSNRLVYWAAAVHVLALAALLVPAGPRARRLALLTLFFLATAASILRCRPPTFMHPVLAGPRYFFFPFVFLTWFWIDVLLSAETQAARFLPAAVAALIVFSTSRHFSRRHEHLDWHAAAHELSQRGRAVFPLHFDGIAKNEWTVTLGWCGDHLCKDP